MKIPIENIYFLLCYAWNKLDEKERVKVSIDDQTELLDLFAKILINSTKMLLKRGIDKSYINHTEELAGIKGKVQISQTIKSNLLFKQKTICTYDDFSSNILVNKILVSTIYKLTRTKGLNEELKKELITLLGMLANIDLIEIKKSLFKQIRLHRNNRFYGFLMNICQIIHESTLPSEKPGQFTFSDFTRNDRKMNQLFEAFVRNFYRKEQHKFKIVKKEIINWQFEQIYSKKQTYLPRMETDISLESKSEKIIIDAKFYRKTMNVNYQKEKIHSSHLYQLFSYLLNQEKQDLKTKTATGILLYPTINKDYDIDFKYKGHSIQIRTVNLNTNWKNISQRLKEIIGINKEV